MAATKQIFTTDSHLRWSIFRWTIRFLLFVFLAMIPVVIITLVWKKIPLLPALNISNNVHKINNPVIPKDLTKQEAKKYKGYADFLLAKKK